MKISKREGFTLIELLVALVVSGLLMASLVGISSAVQKSFSRSKDITELQSNLRFAMKSLVDDLGRIAFMYSPDPSQDPSAGNCPNIPVGQQAIVFNAGPPLTLTLRGNFVSSRDYLLDFNTNRIMCRNGMDTFDFPNCGFGAAYEPYLAPFADGPTFTDLFCQNETVRVDVGSRSYCYHTIAGATAGTLSVMLTPLVNRNQVTGNLRWINPVTTVTYSIASDATYISRYQGGTNDQMRWVLNRTSTDCRGNQSADITDFLLPPQDQQTPGLTIELLDDTNGSLRGTPVIPNIRRCSLIPSSGAQCLINPITNRAMIITLRARTEMEDPDFTIFTYNADPTTRNMGIDLDLNPTNGLAHVRMERTVVELRNLAINP